MEISSSKLSFRLSLVDIDLLKAHEEGIGTAVQIAQINPSPVRITDTIRQVETD